MKTKTFFLKKIALIMGLFLISFVQNANAQMEKTLASNIKSVTVFLNRAQVLNTADVMLNAGTTELTFEGLSTKIIKQSIQVSGKGSFTILSVKHQINYLKNVSQNNAKITALNDSLEFFNDKIKLINIQLTNARREEELILSNKVIGGDAGLTAQKLKDMADLYRVRLNETQTLIYQLDKNTVTFSKKITKINAQIQELSRNSNKPSSEIVVVVTTASPTQANFELNYIVPDAGWNPIYDLRAKDAQSPMQLTYKANVYQNTGIDWKNVKITLSTGNPSESGVKPELSVAYVGFYNPQLAQVAITSNRGMSNESRNYNADLKMKKESAKSDDQEDEKLQDALTVANTTQINTNTFATEFDIAMPYSIPSDNKPQLVDVKNYEIKTHYTYASVPRMDFDAFLMAKLTDWEQYNLLPGQANVYFEGTFVGETYLNTQNTKDTLAISLGRDKKIVIKRVKTKDLSSKKFIGTNVKEEISFDINIRNTKKTEITLTIEDRIPVPKESSIEVELIDAKDASYDKNTGKLTWKITLKPNEARKLSFKYSIKYPKGRVLNYEM